MTFSTTPQKMSEKVNESKNDSDSANNEMLIFVPMSITRSQLIQLTADDNPGGYESTIFVSCLPEELKSELVIMNKSTFNDVFSAILKACPMIANEDVFVIVPKEKSLRNNVWWENRE